MSIDEAALAFNEKFRNAPWYYTCGIKDDTIICYTSNFRSRSEERRLHLQLTSFRGYPVIFKEMGEQNEDLPL